MHGFLRLTACPVCCLWLWFPAVLWCSNRLLYRAGPACCLVLDLQISVYGMNERIGLVSFPPRQEAFDKPYSQETAHMIDQEVCAAVLTGLVCDTTVFCLPAFCSLKAFCCLKANNRQTATDACLGRAEPSELCALQVS